MKKTILFATCLITLLTSINLSANSDSCSNVRIDIEKLGPIRNQAIAGLCFAFEISDLITYKLGQRVSALDLALSYYRATKLKRFTSVYRVGGDTETTLKGANNLGFCLEDHMPSNEILDGPDEIPQTFTKFNWLEKNPWFKNESYVVAQSIFPEISLPNYLKISQNASLKKKISLLQQIACPNRIHSPIDLKNYQAESSSEVPQLIEIINSQLNSNNIIGIGFRSNDLYGEENNKDDENHATTLVARRWNEVSNSCEYLMRDNFGDQCNLYQKHFDCQNGYIWVNEAFLLKNLYEVEYIN